MVMVMEEVDLEKVGMVTVEVGSEMEAMVVEVLVEVVIVMVEVG